MSHSSDWSGDVFLRLYKVEGEQADSFYRAKIPHDAVPFVDVEIPGKLLVGLAVSMISNAATHYAENLISRLCAEDGWLAKAIQR